MNYIYSLFELIDYMKTRIFYLFINNLLLIKLNIR